jgi:hypothetical protein
MKKNRNVGDAIIPVPNADHLASGPEYTYGKRMARLVMESDDIGVEKHDYRRYHVEHCTEHDMFELCPTRLYSDGALRLWYKAGRHPRFSVTKALMVTGRQQYYETMGMTRWQTEAEVTVALKECRDEQHFIELLRESGILRTWLYRQRRKIRVTFAFRRKWDARSFTAADYMAEQNQELRRFMIDRGVAVKDVIGSLEKVTEDETGAIYTDDRLGRHLYVVCPSTKSEYLLRIPSRPDMTPAEARLWTFGLEGHARAGGVAIQQET